MLWDFSVRTDHEIEAGRPDLLIIDKSEKNCHIIDVAIPEDGRVRAKEGEKVEKYQDLAREVRKIWGVKGDTHSGRDIGNNTTEVKRKSEDHRTDSEICIVGIGKDS